MITIKYNCKDCKKEVVYELKVNPKSKKKFCEECDRKRINLRSKELYHLKHPIQEIKENQIDNKMKLTWDEPSILL